MSRSTWLCGVVGALVVAGATVGAGPSGAAAAGVPIFDWATLVTAFQLGGSYQLATSITQTTEGASLATRPSRPVSLDLHGNTLDVLDPAPGSPAIAVGPGAVLTISDSVGSSEMNVDGGEFAAAIGGGDGQSAGSVTISGGEVTAIGGQLAAGIGGGRKGDGGRIAISGGDVTAVGTDIAAGIGGGQGGDGAAVTVSGGTVQAVGASNGAGIGGAYDGLGGEGGTLTVSGGAVEASGGWFGPGIGGVSPYPGTDSGSILVTGGTVEAYGGDDGAGIGGGDDADGATVVVNGGEVTATGGRSGAGIGGGADGVGGSLTIGPAGSVTAVNGSSASAVGGGWFTGGPAYRFGTLTNAGVLRVPRGASMTLGAPGTIHSSGTMRIDGALEIDGTLDLTGVLDGIGTVTNSGAITTAPGSGAVVAADGQGPAGTQLLVQDHNYTLHFDVGGSPDPAPSALHAYAATVAASAQSLPPGPTAPAGLAFAGWFTTPDGSGQVTDRTQLSDVLSRGPSAITLHAQYAPAQDVEFTSSATDARVGETYRPAATGGGSGNPIVFAIGPGTDGHDTPDATCTIAASVVTFEHVGACELVADQAGAHGFGVGHASQSISVAKGRQTITFTRPGPGPVTAPAPGSVALAARGGASANPVRFSIDSQTTGFGAAVAACSMADDTTVVLHAAGTCEVDAEQAGDADYLAGSAELEIAVTAPASTATSVSIPEAAQTRRVGQSLAATATVTTPSGSPSGAVQFTVDGESYGPPVPVVESSAGAVVELPEVGGEVVHAGQHWMGASFVPSDPNRYTASGSTPVSFDVVAAATTTHAVILQDELVAQVSATPPGGDWAAGSATFYVNGVDVGTVPVSAGAGVLYLSLPSTDGLEARAVYSGSQDYLGSAGVTVRHNPTLRADLSSASGRNSAGWYRSPVTVTFRCAVHGAAFQTPCPAAKTLHQDGEDQSITRSVTATDGGVTTIRVRHINIDRTAPTVSISGVRPGQRLAVKPSVRCHAHDGLSGLTACTLDHHRHGRSVTYRATAMDRAGNHRSTSVTITMIRRH